MGLILLEKNSDVLKKELTEIINLIVINNTYWMVNLRYKLRRI